MDTLETKPNRARKSRRSDGGKHSKTGKILRMDDPLWGHLEAKRRQTGQSVQSQLRQLVREDMERAAAERARGNKA